MLPKSLLYDLSVNPLAKMLYLIVGDQAWRDDTGTCALSHAELGALIDRTPRVVQDLLATLVERDLLGSYRYGPTQAKVYWLTAAPPAQLPGRHRQIFAGVSGDDPHTPADFFRDTGRILPEHRQISAGTPIGKEHPETGPETTTPTPSVPVVDALPRVAAATIVLPVLDSGDELVAPTVAPKPSRKPRPPARVPGGCGLDDCRVVHGDIGGLTPDADQVLRFWEHGMGLTRPSMNPTQTRLMNEAVADMGVDHMQASVEWAADKGIREIDKFRTGAKTRAGKNPQRAAQLAQQGGDRAHFLDSRQPHRAARYQNQNRPGSTGKPGDKISPDIARTDETWDTPWWNIPGLPDLPDDGAQPDQQQDQP